MYLYLHVCVGCNFLANHTAIFGSLSNRAVYGQFEICRRGPFIPVPPLVKFSNLSEMTLLFRGAVYYVVESM